MVRSDSEANKPAVGSTAASTTDPYRLFFDLSLDMLCVAGTDGFFKRVNPAFTKTLGYDEDALLGQPFVDLVHPDDQADTLKQVEHLKCNQPVLMFENRYRHADGHYLWIQWNSAVPHTDGLIYAMARDVTKQKEEELRFRELTMHIDEIFWLTDPDRTEILYVSPAFEIILGDSPEPLYKDPFLWEKYIHPEDLPRWRENQPKQKLGEFDMHFRVIRPCDQEERILHARAFPVKEKGEVVRVAGVTKDVTEETYLRRALLDESELEKMMTRVEIHKTLCQDLPAMSFASNILERKFLQENPQVAELASKLTEQLQDAATSARMLAYGLAPLEVGQADLQHAFEDLAASAEQVHPSVKVTLHVGDAPSQIDDKLLAQFYYIVRKAVFASLEDDSVTAMDIQVSRGKTGFHASITDDGGAVHSLLSADGSQLFNALRYRAKILDGSVTIESGDEGKGRKVVCEIA